VTRESIAAGALSASRGAPFPASCVGPRRSVGSHLERLGQRADRALCRVAVGALPIVVRPPQPLAGWLDEHREERRSSSTSPVSLDRKSAATVSTSASTESLCGRRASATTWADLCPPGEDASPPSEPDFSSQPGRGGGARPTLFGAFPAEVVIGRAVPIWTRVDDLMLGGSIRPPPLIGVTICGVSTSPTLAQRPAPQASATKNAVADAMQKASRRFHIPVAWLRTVMRAESDGDTRCVSDKGAIGLMQLMQKTYQELSVEHGLGSDSFDPRDNIMAGAAYLAEIFGRPGSSGFLAAYNAGPRRNQEHLRGRPLPSQIVDYVADGVPRLGFEVRADWANG
jgi:Transglycosylase SLT domain